MSKEAIARDMIARYNAQDADAYVELMTEDSAEANYRGDVVRDGKEGVRSGLAKMFGEFPENRVEIIAGNEFGNYVTLHERVFRSSAAEPFDVLAVYTFEGDKVSRVEFIR